MSRSRKDGRFGGAHRVIYGTYLRDGGGSNSDGSPSGRREPMKPRTRRYMKRSASRARRRKFKQNIYKEIVNGLFGG